MLFFAGGVLQWASLSVSLGMFFLGCGVTFSTRHEGCRNTLKVSDFDLSKMEHMLEVVSHTVSSCRASSSTRLSLKQSHK